MPPPWLELTTSEPSLQRHAREAAGHEADASRPDEHEGPQVDVARRDAGLDQVGQVESASVGWAM